MTFGLLPRLVEGNFKEFQQKVADPKNNLNFATIAPS